MSSPIGLTQPSHNVHEGQCEKYIENQSKQQLGTLSRNQSHDETLLTGPSTSESSFKSFKFVIQITTFFFIIKFSNFSYKSKEYAAD